MPIKMPSEKARKIINYAAGDPTATPIMQALAVLVLEMRDDITCLRGRIAELEAKQPEPVNYDDEMEVVTNHVV